MAPVRFDHRVAVDAGLKARPQRHHERRAVQSRAGICLRKNCVYNGRWRQLIDRLRLRIDQNGDLTRLQHLRHIRHQRLARRDPFHFVFIVIHGLRKGHRPPHRQRARQFGHHHRDAAAVQPPGHTGRQVAGALYQHQQIVKRGFAFHITMIVDVLFSHQ